jgi:phage-related tail fiber protein
MIVSDGTYWDKIDGSQTEVSSVNGMTGAVTVSTITGNAGTASKWAAPMTFALSGDATTSGSFDGSATTTLPLTLAASGVSAGTWSKVTVNTKGLVTTGANIATGDVTTALGFTPVNKAGDTMSGALTASGFSGPLTGNVTGNVTGNASTASKWAATMTFGTSGDATGSGSFDGSTGTTIALTLANSGATAGTYSALVVNAKGLVTAGANMVVTGDVTGTSSGAGLALTLGTSGVTAGTYIGFGVNAKGLVTSVTLPTTVAGFGITDAVTTSSTIDGGSF